MVSYNAISLKKKEKILSYIQMIDARLELLRPFLLTIKEDIVSSKKQIEKWHKSNPNIILSWESNNHITMCIEISLIHKDKIEVFVSAYFEDQDEDYRLWNFQYMGDISWDQHQLELIKLLDQALDEVVTWTKETLIMKEIID